MIWNDDSQVSAGPVQKIYGTKPGAKIVIQELDQGLGDELLGEQELELFAANGV